MKFLDPLCVSIALDTVAGGTTVSVAVWPNPSRMTGGGGNVGVGTGVSVAVGWGVEVGRGGTEGVGDGAGSLFSEQATTAMMPIKAAVGTRHLLRPLMD